MTSAGRNASPPGALDALSPVDGRYAEKCTELRALFSEAALIRHRVRVASLWFLHLATDLRLPELAELPDAARRAAESLAAGAAPGEAAAVKAEEARVAHDLKAVEYYVRDRLRAAGARDAELGFVHFACTSEDVNNLAYALMLRAARDTVLLPAVDRLLAWLTAAAHAEAATPMLSRTHGQPASPTTLGKEFANVAARLAQARAAFAAVAVLGKINGAVGNWNAHVVAYPQLDWRAASRRFVERLGLGYSEYTTQIEPHDWLAACCDALARLDTVLIDFARDAWGYIALGYFRQRVVAGEIGSSTMPHKVNPIDFENAEGNLGLANALLRHFADKLPVSRWQRDLSDSTVLRNLGVGLAHALLGMKSIERGLARIEPDAARMAAELDANWEVLAEALQTVMRRHGVPDAYERLKELTRGRRVDASTLAQIIASLPLPAAERERLALLTPAAYVGLAARLARDA